MRPWSHPLFLKATKVILSLFVVYHLSVAIILANGGSFLGRYLQEYILPYANTLGINATWNFFSPDPAHTMYFEYRVSFEDAEGVETQAPIDGYFPPQKEEFVRDTSDRRLLYAMRFLILDPQRLETVMVPWLCRKFPGASSIFFRHLIHRIPLLDVAHLNASQPLLNLRDVVQTTQAGHRCNRPSNEVGQ